MKAKNKVLVAATLIASVVSTALSVPASADPEWGHGWQGREWHGHGHGHAWRERPYAYVAPGVVYAPPPAVVYAPPPAVVYAPPPPPVVYAPAPPSFNLVLPLNFR